MTAPGTTSTATEHGSSPGGNGLDRARVGAAPAAAAARIRDPPRDPTPPAPRRCEGLAAHFWNGARRVMLRRS